MDMSSAAWLVDQEMEDPREFMNQHQQTRPYNNNELFLDSQSFRGYQDLLLTKNNHPYNIHTNNIHHAAAAATTINQQDHLKKQETYNHYNKLPSNSIARSSSFAPADNCGNLSNTFTISFGDLSTTSSPATTINKNQLIYNHDSLKYNEDMSLDELLGSIELPKRVPTTRRNHRQAQEHVLAERKRREKLTQRFITLSALLPEIKKMDKATVLEDAGNYIKQLQNRVKELEETSILTKNRKSVPESITCSMRRRSKLQFDYYCGDEASSFDHDDEAYYNCSLPANNINNNYNPGIKVRISGSNILVRIYCSQKNSSVAVKALTEMERLHFTIMCNSVLQVSATAALITIIAQMSEELVMTAMDLVACLQSSLSSFL